MTGDFDWINDECVVLREQRQIAVYPTKNGGIAIREEKQWPHQEEDTLILIRPEHAQRLCDAIMSAAAEIGPGLELAVKYVPSETVLIPSRNGIDRVSSAALTPAEKQRRYRKRQKQGNANGAGRYPDGNADHEIGNGPMSLTGPVQS